MSELAPINQDDVEIWRPSAAINPERLNYLWTLAERMADSSLVPESLRTEGRGNDKTDLPREKIVANVFAVVEQADRWNISPFALLACAAIVHGRLGFEGKVISSVLKSSFGIDLDYDWNGTGENMSITIRGKKPGSDKILEVTGTVAEWKTTGNGSPWRPTTYAKMLAYRGAREWSRLHEPSAILGVLADDEIQQIGFERQAQIARSVAPSLEGRFGGVRNSEGFDPASVNKQIADARQVPMDIIDAATGEIIENSEVQAGQVSSDIPGRKGDEPGASAQRTSSDARGSGTADASSRSQQTRPSSSTAEPAAHNGSGAGSSPAAGTTDSPASVPSSRAADDSVPGEGEGPSSLPSLSRDAFLKFSGQLARMQSEENVIKAKDAWFKDNKVKPSAKEIELFKQITQAHVDRAKAKMDVGKVMADIQKWVEADIPEDL